MSQEENIAGEKYWQMIEPIWAAISIYDGPERFLNQFRRVNPHIGHLFALIGCIQRYAMVDSTSSLLIRRGFLAPEAAEGFLAIGLKDCADVIKEAMQFFGGNYPRDLEKREEILDGILGDEREEWDPFFRLDKRFYKLVEGDRFPKSADEYGRKHAV